MRITQGILGDSQVLPETVGRLVIMLEIVFLVDDWPEKLGFVELTETKTTLITKDRQISSVKAPMDETHRKLIRY